MSDLSKNPFVDGPLPVIFARTALPVIFVMGMNGLMTVVDALFLGHYVGAAALGAVTLMFPLYMLIIALATLVATGMASPLARHLGAHCYTDARRVYASAHWLAITTGVALILAYVLLGGLLVELIAGGSEPLVFMSETYLRILVIFSPLMFVLSVNTDALRSEGRVGFMAVASLLVSLGNIGFDYLLIAVFDLGVAGSAYGTVLAQVAALLLITAYRSRVGTVLHPLAALRRITVTGWGSLLALGAPQSLNFVGVALVSSAVLVALQWVRVPDYETTVTAYGIVTRTLTFAILPVLGLAQAMQTITGNNLGAGNGRRVRGSLAVAAGVALLFCATVQGIATLFAGRIGALFVSDPRVVAEVASIMPVMVMLYALSGPLVMVASHFQAVGDAPRAALLGVSKPYLFALPLTFALPGLFGAAAIWWAAPAAEGMLALLTAVVVFQAARGQKTSREIKEIQA